MNKQSNQLSREELTKASIQSLEERGVKLADIADIVYFLQKDYDKNLTFKKCENAVKSVLRKREVSYAILTGIELDKLAEAGQLAEPICSIVKNDYALYGIDEIIPLSIVNLYGSIGLTNFGYLDKLKPGIIEKLDNNNESVNAFLDDLVAGIAASGVALLAHGKVE